MCCKRINCHQRDISLDIIRIIAIISVVGIHASADFLKFCETGTEEYILAGIFNGICRLGVPLFVMISGALMLNEEKVIDIRDIFSKYIKNVLILLLVWSGIYAVIYVLWIPIVHGGRPDFYTFLTNLLLGHYHMWYLYMLIGLYLITPFLRTFVRKENRRAVGLFIVCAVIFQFVPPFFQKFGTYCTFFETAGRVLNKFHLGFFSGYSIYYISGWYITQIGTAEKISERSIFATGVFSLLICIIYVQITADYAFGYDNGNLFIFLYSVMVFTLVYHINWKKMQAKTVNRILFLSKMSFAVYIMHPMFLDLFKTYAGYHGHVLIYMGFSLVFAFVMSLLFGICLSRIPGIKRLVRM